MHSYHLKYQQILQKIILLFKQYKYKLNLFYFKHKTLSYIFIIIFCICIFFITLIIFLTYINNTIKTNNEIILNNIHKYTEVFETENILNIGTWGEDKLTNILHIMGYIDGIHFYRNKQFTINGRILKPDIFLKINNDMSIIIDSKTPWITYQKYISSNDKYKEKMLKNHTMSIKRHLLSLATKEYYRIPGSLPFIIMFLPLETMFSDACRLESDIQSICHKNHIYIATPSSLYMILQIIKLLINNKNFSTHVSETQQDLIYMINNFETLINNLDNAVYDLQSKSNIINSLKKNIQSDFLIKLKKIQEVGHNKYIKQNNKLCIDIKKTDK